jgi:hypothetical protein
MVSFRSAFAKKARRSGRSIIALRWSLYAGTEVVLAALSKMARSCWRA